MTPPLLHRLIDPAPLADVDLFLAAARAIVGGEPGAHPPRLGPQRFLVKEPWIADGGYRALLEARLRERLGLSGNDDWRLLTVTSGTAALRLAARALLPRSCGRPAKPRSRRRRRVQRARPAWSTASARRSPTRLENWFRRLDHRGGADRSGQFDGEDRAMRRGG